MTPRDVLDRIFAAALAAVHPAAVTADTVRRLPLPPAPHRVHLVALGKAAHPMAESAVAALAERGVEPAGGIVVAHTAAAAPHPALATAVGDHPTPGAASFHAADRIAAAAAAVQPEDLAIVLLSGGTSSLAGAPIAGVDAAEFSALFDVLLEAGIPIGLTNPARSRVARWGAGRLAVALAPARVACLVLSDVPEFPFTLVGSAPCAPEPMTAAEVVARLREAGCWEQVPPGIRRRWLDVATSGVADTPPADHPAFANVTMRLLVDNAMACEAAAAAAQAAGLEARVHHDAVRGDAHALGERFAARLRGSAAGTAHVWGGEAAVKVPDEAVDARGGRMQALALSAARALRGVDGITLLAAGTDGRDGKTDAAGAIVDGATWDRIAASGRDPAADLAGYRSNPALDAAGVLVPARATGTNVADLVVGIVHGGA